MAIDPSSTAFDPRQFDAIYPPGVERHYWNICRNAILTRAVRAAGNGNVLEVGCGKGLVVAHLRAQGIEARGVDLAEVTPLPEVAAHVRTGVDLFDIGTAHFHDVGIVLLLDVIEHIEHPTDFVERIRAHVPSAHTFIFTVPARQELFSNYDEFNRHFLRYDRTTLRRHVDTTGKRNWKASYFFHALYPAAWLVLKWKGARETRYVVPKTVLQRLGHRLLGWIFLVEYSVLPGGVPGTSIIATVSDPHR
ncbi:MAG: class I SAM-dependent methyltransferase [Flavobacteriales bacterium]